MNIAKYATIGLLLMGMTTFNSCTKEVVGPQGEQGIQGNQGEKGEQGPGAKTYEFNMTFAANAVEQYYQIPGLNFSDGDALLGFALYDVYNGTGYWAPLPYTYANRVYLFNFSENSGSFWVNLKNATTGANFPFTTATTLSFRAVHIKSSWISANPDVDLNNYEEVKNALNL